MSTKRLVIGLVAGSILATAFYEAAVGKTACEEKTAQHEVCSVKELRNSMTKSHEGAVVQIIGALAGAALLTRKRESGATPG
ncbi:MAG: hypothetical protein ACAH83_14110 [Alphaproteobacteria bacterium]